MKGDDNIELITQVDDFSQYEYGTSDDLSTYEREVTVSIRQDGTYFHSDHRVGIKWAVEQIEYHGAELIRMYVEGNTIVSIDIKTEKSCIKFQGKHRGYDNLSRCFTYPSNCISLS